MKNEEVVELDDYKKIFLYCLVKNCNKNTLKTILLLNNTKYYVIR